jgi:PAS domain S-box-containing protein
MVHVYRWKYKSSTEIDGKPARIIAVRDIDIRKKAELKAQKAANELSLLIDSANAPIFGLDKKGMINEWNQKIAEITGFDANEVMGCNLVDELISKEYQTNVQKVINDALNDKETSNYELVFVTKNNQYVVLLLNASARQDIDGVIEGVIGVGQDITELDSYRTKMEQKVSERTRELNAIFTLSPDGFVLVNNKQKVVYVNPALLEMTGFKLEDVLDISSEQFGNKMLEL